MNDAKKLAELYPSGVQAVAKLEHIYNEVTTDMLVPSAQTDTLYQTGLAMVMNPGNFPPVSEERIEAAKRILLSNVAIQVCDETEREIALEYVNLVWPACAEKMRENSGFAHWMFEGGIIFSFKMFHYYSEAVGLFRIPDEVLNQLPCWTQVFQMDVSYGEYHDMYGNPEIFHRGDLVRWHTINHGLYRGITWRGPWFAYYLRQAGEGANVLDLCSGALNLERRFGYLESGLKQHVIAYDSNPDIPKYLSRLFPKPLEEYGLEFRNEVFTKAFEDPELYGNQRLVLMQGGMSYVYDSLEDILKGIRQLLETSVENATPSRFVGEVELVTPDLQQVGTVLSSSDQPSRLHPDLTVDDAVNRITDIVERIGGYEIEDIHFDGSAFFGKSIHATTVIFVLKAV